MKTDVTLKIAGAAGQGIQTIGDLLSDVCHQSGLFTFSVDDYESRVRGGHNFNLLRISDKELTAPGNRLDILVCINMEAPFLVNPTAPVFLVGWGSARGNILEAVERLKAQGIEIGAAVFKDLWPMDRKAIGQVLGGKKLIMVEQNETGQLGRLLAQEAGIACFDTIFKYDGRPFFPDYIVQKAKELVN